MFAEILNWEPPLIDLDEEFWSRWATATKWARPAQADGFSDLLHAQRFRHTQLGKIFWQLCRATALHGEECGSGNSEFAPSAVGELRFDLANIPGGGYVLEDPPPDGCVFDPRRVRSWFNSTVAAPCPDDYESAHGALESYLLNRIRVPALDRLMIQRTLATEAVDTGLKMGFAPRVSGKKGASRLWRRKEYKPLVAAEVTALEIACETRPYSPSQIRAFFTDSQAKGIAWAGCVWALLDDAERRGVLLM